jgi:hypothetical protein
VWVPAGAEIGVLGLYGGDGNAARQQPRQGAEPLRRVQTAIMNKTSAYSTTHAVNTGDGGLFMRCNNTAMPSPVLVFWYPLKCRYIWRPRNA